MSDHYLLRFIPFVTLLKWRKYRLKRVPVIQFAKINYLEKREFVKIAKFKTREIFLF